MLSRTLVCGMVIISLLIFSVFKVYGIYPGIIKEDIKIDIEKSIAEIENVKVDVNGDDILLIGSESGLAAISIFKNEPLKEKIQNANIRRIICIKNDRIIGGISLTKIIKVNG